MLLLPSVSCRQVAAVGRRVHWLLFSGSVQGISQDHECQLILILLFGKKIIISDSTKYKVLKFFCFVFQHRKEFDGLSRKLIEVIKCVTLSPSQLWHCL